MAGLSASAVIRSNLDRVTSMRLRSLVDGESDAVGMIKRLQARRFAGTYADLGRVPDSAVALRFFLSELYGEHDFTRRDEQFGRIAGALERLFPQAVAQLAVDLTEMHALTEQLDHDLARQWLLEAEDVPLATRYVRAWRAIDRRHDRLRQLSVTLHMGHELVHLTKKRSLRTALRLMRRPAQSAGLEALQHFLESGFDAFASVQDPVQFLKTIEDREGDWIACLFSANLEDISRRLDSAWRECARQGNQETTFET